MYKVWRTPPHEKLPSELWRDIFRKLEPADLGRCLRVCRNWNIIVRADDFWDAAVQRSFPNSSLADNKRFETSLEKYRYLISERDKYLYPKPQHHQAQEEPDSQDDNPSALRKVASRIKEAPWGIHLALLFCLGAYIALAIAFWQVGLELSAQHYAAGSAGQSAAGFFAAGQVAYGFIAIGQIAIGVVAIGQVSIGVVGVGMASVSILGGVGMAAASVGFSIGLLTFATYVRAALLGIGTWKTKRALLGVSILAPLFQDINHMMFGCSESARVVRKDPRYGTFNNGYL